MKGKPLIAALSVLAKVLPGDHIHHVAPSSKPLPPVDALDAKARAIYAAEAKRRRKMEKRRKQK